MPSGIRQFTSRQIVAARPAKEPVDPRRPYGMFVEPERTARGDVEPVATILIANRECPYRCLMCDLWRHTTDSRVPDGAVLEQIDFALQRLPPARHLKLYNAGNFFDAQAIPRADHAAIADRAAAFATLVVENHPRLCGPRCANFRRGLAGRLEIAIGLETVHPQVLAALNKGMTLNDVRRAAEFLRTNDIDLRAFVLLRPPFLDEVEGIEWAIRTLEFAFDQGFGCASVIATRAGNGLMEQLAHEGSFHPPRLESLETVVEEGIRMGRGRVFADLWGLPREHDCPGCAPARVRRLASMNLSQQVPPRVACEVCR